MENPAPEIPENYIQLPGSERRPSKETTLLGPANESETFPVTIVLRRRPDGQEMPDFDYFAKTPPQNRERLSKDEFAEKYGANPEDIEKVTDFAKKAGLTVQEVRPESRSVIISGTVAEMNKAFLLKLGRYQHTIENKRRTNSHPVTQTYRGRDGFIHVPKDLSHIIVGVFGLDDRNITKRNQADPANTIPRTTQQFAALYNFPKNSAAGQTIAIFSESGYQPADINSTFGGNPPQVTDISVNAGNDGTAEQETTQDICIAAAAAPGAAIAVYFTTYDQAGWVNLIQRVVHPLPGDPSCSVLSSSFYVSDNDDKDSLDGITLDWINAVDMAFHDAAVQGVTVCIASGDTGSDSKMGDGQQHVQYPASDPWVLSVGGTTLGNVNGNSFDEFVWNEPFFGATGGGVSAFFPLPSYQQNCNVPVSLKTNAPGRGLPDVAANASPNAGYNIVLGGAQTTGNGTSASAPLWAGLIAVINAALGTAVGFINTQIYQFGSAPFHDIDGSVGPVDNGLNRVPGYPAGIGWDACTGWGSPDGQALLAAFQALSPANAIASNIANTDAITGVSATSA